MKVKKIVFIILTLILLQLGRIIFKNLIFTFIDRTLLSDLIVNIMFWKVITGMIIGIVLGFFRYRNKNVYSSMLVHTFINTFGS